MKVEFINTQKVLSSTNINLADYVINPYRGCEFGCIYCYSKQNKNITNNFFNKLGVKINAINLLEKELYYKNPKRVLLGSTTECFQYKELKYNITEKIIKILNKFKIPYTILTKSHLIERYLDLISENKENKIYFTFNIVSDKIIKVLERKTPFVSQRLNTIKKILEKNINLRIHIGPFIPYISSLEKIIEKLPPKITEVNIEVYNNKMGNFNDMFIKIKKNINNQLADRIAYIYSNKKNYLNFVERLKVEIEKFKNKTKAKFYYIIPKFNEFYNGNIDYNKYL